MTYIQMRQLIAEAEVRYKAQRAAIMAEYSAQDQSAARAARAKHARDARLAVSLDRGAQEYLDLWAANAALFASHGALSGIGTPQEIAEVQRACELSDGRYAFKRWSATNYEVTKYAN